MYIYIYIIALSLNAKIFVHTTTAAAHMNLGQVAQGHTYNDTGDAIWCGTASTHSMLALLLLKGGDPSARPFALWNLWGSG